MLRDGQAVENLLMFGEVPIEFTFRNYFSRTGSRLWMGLRACLRLIEAMMQARMLGAQPTINLRADNW